MSFKTFEGSRSTQLYTLVNNNAHPQCSTLALSLNWWAYALLVSHSFTVSSLKHPLCLEVRVKVKATLSAGMGVELGQT